MKNQRRRRWYFWGATGLVTLILASCAIGWMLFQAIPPWYQPVSITGKRKLQKIRNDLLGTLDTFGTALVHHQGPFQYRLKQDQLNAWLSARRQIWPQSRHWLPRQLSDPFIALAPDGIRVGITYKNGEIQTVINTHLDIEATADGLRVHLANVQAGELNIPRSWVRQELAKLDNDRWPAGEKAPFQYNQQPLPPLVDLCEQALFPSSWIWENGEQPFRIVKVQCTQGTLVLTIEPLGEAQAGSQPNSQADPPSRPFDWDRFLK
jgi:hypothetical protein